MFTDKREFKQAFIEKIEMKFGKKVADATNLEAYEALGALISERINQKWQQTNEHYQNTKQKRVYYFSMEFLIGRLLGNNLLNLGVLSLVESGLQDLGFSLLDLEEKESDAGLGSGGLGRLAACFLDSLASCELAGYGHGIRYKYGMFEQRMIDGNQLELPDKWLSNEFVWEVRKGEEAVEVRFGGEVLPYEVEGKLCFVHSGYETLNAVPYDVAVVGYENETVNTLRLWSAEPTSDDILQKAKYEQVLENFLLHQRSLEAISEFLYPDDTYIEGKRLRLKQEYFLVSAGVQSIVKSFESLGLPWSQFPEVIALHINDTHPALVIPELMRILIDEKQLGWDEAWHITKRSVSYTNHTILSEALEVWPIELMRSILPRIYMIIEEINERFCRMLWEIKPGDFERIARLAIIADGKVKMAHLAIVGSHSINGVAKLHTEILKKREMKEFFETFPDRFTNKTNGITHRRWLMHANPSLAHFLTECIDEKWKREPSQLLDLLKWKDDAGVLDKLFDIKQQNKERLIALIANQTGIIVDPLSLFDVQIKRLHGYKRQLLNVLHIIHLYHEIKINPNCVEVPRTFIFAAKAASGYHFAKKVIKLIHTIADVINHDPDMNDKLKVIFLENYSVSLAEVIIPAANVSEQISTASKEASGTGNMKLMMNGAITLGTMDGANIEIYEYVGPDNIYTFGLSAKEVLDAYNYYSARDLYREDTRIRRSLDALVCYSPFSKGKMEFQDIYDALLTYNDEYFVLKDFNSYVATQQQIAHDYQDVRNWSKKSLTNIAYSGMFSSDYTVMSYASDIWQLVPQNVRSKALKGERA